MVILLFMVHPNIVQYMVQNFKCMDVDGDNRLLLDLELLCYSIQHKLFSIVVVGPSLLVWGLGIPFFGFVLLLKEKDKLKTIAVKEKLGFLFRGYTKSFYYWEIIIIYRKIALICLSVFVMNVGAIAQALVVFVLLIM